MNRRYSAIAVSALALGAAALTATNASAGVDPRPEPRDTTAECNYPNHPLCKVVPVVATPRAATDHSAWDDYGAGALEAGASALGGAGIAFGGMWLYRRRHAPAI